MRLPLPQPVIKPRSRHHQRHAFTLLEVVFALGLSLVLLTAMLSAIDLYRQVSTAGREDVEQSQLARTILRSFEIDVRSVMFTPPPAEEEEELLSSDGETIPAAEEADEVVVETVDAAAVLSLRSGGIFGDATTLVIHAGRPPGKLESLQLTEPVSDLKSISYFLATPGAEGLPGTAASFIDTNDSGQPQGLARLEGDRMAVEFADAAGDLQLLAAQTRLLAAEVDFLQFRYFDGLTWLEAWDSVAYERLPNAIEITLGINSNTEADASTIDASTIGTAPRPSRLYRFVVAIPSATPYIETTTVDGT